MKDKSKFFITDVFGENKYSGNQLATFFECASLADQEMQKIAREMNFSETTFIMSDSQINGGYDVRIFTPEREVDFAGHPTLGTAYIIQKHIVKQLTRCGFVRSVFLLKTQIWQLIQDVLIRYYTHILLKTMRQESCL